jgi:hypothetical protein
MTQLRYCRVCHDLHPLEQPWPLACVAHWGTAYVARSDLPCPSIRADGMDAIQSMADGQMYDGRSAYYDSVRRAGCEIVGDDRAGFGKAPTIDSVIPGNIEADIKRTIQELSNG